MTVSDALGRSKNNFDLVRLIAALSVIYGHSFSLVPAFGKQDFLISLCGYASAGMAVKVFFFLSGLLVTNSLYTNKSVFDYSVHRFFRIFPGLAFVLLITALVIGPLCTNLALRDYFGNADVYRYIRHQLLMRTWGTQLLPGYYNLPGVFTDNFYKNQANAALWTLVAEVFAYIFLAAAYLAGIKNKRFATILFLLVIVDSLLPTRIIFTFLPLGNEDISYLPFCFACGSLLSLYKDSVNMSWSMVLGFLLLFFLLHETPYQRFFFYLATFSFVLCFAVNETVMKLRPKVDISYGVYLWGFPIQQTLAHFYPAMSTTANCLIAMILAGVMGCISWFLIEKNCMNFGKQLIMNARRKNSMSIQ
jgi:peptidoglycan/LPS O-acetylase OafA/YrhL